MIVKIYIGDFGFDTDLASLLEVIKRWIVINPGVFRDLEIVFNELVGQSIDMALLGYNDINERFYLTKRINYGLVDGKGVKFIINGQVLVMVGCKDLGFINLNTGTPVKLVSAIFSNNMPDCP